MSLTRSGLLANNRSSVLAEDGPYREGSRTNWLRKWSCAISSIRMHCLESRAGVLIVSVSQSMDGRLKSPPRMIWRFPATSDTFWRDSSSASMVGNLSEGGR